MSVQRSSPLDANADMKLVTTNYQLPHLGCWNLQSGQNYAGVGSEPIPVETIVLNSHVGDGEKVIHMSTWPSVST